MKKYLKYTILFTVVIILFTLNSCKKSYLELTPPTSLTPQTALASESDLSTALLGGYSGLRNVDYYGRTVPLLGDLMADNAYQSLTNSNRYPLFNTYTFIPADGNIAGFWNAAYIDILRCNNIINSTITGSINVNQYKGEAYAIRALCYFTLVRYFARPFTDNPNGLGVPIITTFDVSVFPPRSKISEVYTLINADLTQAFSLMTIYKNSTQFSKYAARGLQAKVYLTMGDKANAKTAALDVINNGGFTVVTAANYVAYWNNALPRIDKVETLFEVSSDAISSNGFDALPNIYSQSGYGDFLASDDFYALLTGTDVRKGLYAAGTRGGIPAIFVNKFPNTFGTDVSDTKVLRLSEIYLIAAEASLTTNEVDALTYSNFITSRRNAPAIASTGAQLFEDIITERRKELAFEGDRYMDLQRLKRDVVRSVNFPASARTIPYSDFRRILPIPQTELDVNANIRSQQNPGY
ncbi:MAG: RagB/SusD family nutrient uptake outer membrane protein [Chitinophagaceae bacterium]|nr:RagB/SusD family nutrient uptake outer membrane protein [Chitinophagaceae bacterium]